MSEPTHAPHTRSICAGAGGAAAAHMPSELSFSRCAGASLAPPALMMKVEELLEEKQREIPQADKCMHMNEEKTDSRHTQPIDYKQKTAQNS